MFILNDLKTILEANQAWIWSLEATLNGSKTKIGSYSPPSKKKAGSDESGYQEANADQSWSNLCTLVDAYGSRFTGTVFYLTCKQAMTQNNSLGPYMFVASESDRAGHQSNPSPQPPVNPLQGLNLIQSSTQPSPFDQQIILSERAELKEMRRTLEKREDELDAQKAIIAEKERKLEWEITTRKRELEVEHLEKAAKLERDHDNKQNKLNRELQESKEAKEKYLRLKSSAVKRLKALKAELEEKYDSLTSKAKIAADTLLNIFTKTDEEDSGLGAASELTENQRYIQSIAATLVQVDDLVYTAMVGKFVQLTHNASDPAGLARHANTFIEQVRQAKANAANEGDEEPAEEEEEVA